MPQGTIGRGMNEHEQRALKYREKAEELRAILPSMKDPLYRKILEKLIVDYGKLADAQEKLAKS